jgi:hypothetical protein
MHHSTTHARPARIVSTWVAIAVILAAPSLLGGLVHAFIHHVHPHAATVERGLAVPDRSKGHDHHAFDDRECPLCAASHSSSFVLSNHLTPLAPYAPARTLSCTVVERRADTSETLADPRAPPHRT